MNDCEIVTFETNSACNLLKLESLRIITAGIILINNFYDLIFALIPIKIEASLIVIFEPKAAP